MCNDAIYQEPRSKVEQEIEQVVTHGVHSKE
jgi:hypothetical protein